jgi:hypothetical protein
LTISKFLDYARGMSSLSRIPLFLALLAAPAAAQSGTLDQVSPFGTETPGTGASSAGYNFDATSLTWQCETAAGLTGQLEGIEFEVNGTIGANFNVAILLGNAWQAGTPAYSGSYTLNNGVNEIAWVDVSASNINLNAGDPYVIQISGTGTGVWGTGSYESPTNTLYTLPLFLNGNIFGPEWRIGFHTYMLSGPSLTSFGSCPGSMTYTVSGATPFGKVAFMYARGTGSQVLAGGPCGGTMLGLDSSVKLGGVISADAAGSASLSFNVPAGACGRFWGQALDVTTCGTTNVLQVQ